MPKILLPGSPARRSRAAARFRNWAADIIATAQVAGRSMEEFAVPGGWPRMKAAADALVAQGVGVVMGAGNVFHLRWSGDTPIVVHSRPLASRVVRLIS